MPDIFGLPGEESDRRLQTAAAGGSASRSEANRKVGSQSYRNAQETSQQTSKIKR
ncbi:hypothetical protein [Pseudolysobacter antarcticus]|uniref:hypothetical protein n=1 Tax=Pseudolysobacter antarcticus TaxID=2511995 RepID=UPI0013EC6E6A|nr:hypothetical protein [Pseudolysobacter antarcticus]